ncbi:hypothetical protein [Metabacillus litoralis]|uniref:hypothetical protein n=1 Tax=Metabacillus litoralis TaxID=152268 RepID=UPI001CFD6D94|nr:hypothetical protein [Metabacillus litoralis]
MKENDRFKELIDEIHSLPEPDYEKDFDINKQSNIYENLIIFSRSFEQKQKRGDLIKRLSTGVVGLALLILFSVVLITNFDDSTNVTTPEIKTFEEFFHQEMEIKHEAEDDFSYNLVHTELNTLHQNDAIAVFREYNPQGEQIFIAYFEKQNSKWEWKQTRGAEWDSPVKWSSMHQSPYIYSGAISDNSIKEVYAGEKRAKVITVEGNKRFWYVISPEKNVKVMFVKKNGSKEIVEEVDQQNVKEKNSDETLVLDVREDIWNQLTENHKKHIQGTWKDASYQKIILRETMGNITDKTFIGKEVFILDFPSKDNPTLGGVTVYADLKTHKLIGYGYRE